MARSFPGPDAPPATRLLDDKDRTTNLGAFYGFEGNCWSGSAGWYTRYNPYKESAPGVPLGIDDIPTFTEVTAGYTYAVRSEKAPAANLKLNYVWRSKNFLRPCAAQTGEQGGDSVIAAFQVAF